MKIQLVSYILDLEANDKINITADIINNSKADLIFFPGNTLDSISDAFEVEKLVKNRKSTALIEVSQMSIGDLTTEIIHCPFLIKNGKLINMHTFQHFTTSDVIENNLFLAEAFVNELETRRKFEVDGKKCLLLQCGENNILKNIQSDDNNVVVRIDDKSLVKRFNNVLKETDIILNSIHNPQPGNQNKLHKRREFFSKNARAYFSTNNCDELSSTAKSIQYAYINGKQIDNPEPIIEEKGLYMYRMYEV
ncbi:MAG: hypothetical protein J6T60_06610 [Bacteroidales bacterium]|nr:hypothetical protein [Bacteroidales bacterium]